MTYGLESYVTHTKVDIDLRVAYKSCGYLKIDTNYHNINKYKVSQKSNAQLKISILL